MRGARWLPRRHAPFVKSASGISRSDALDGSAWLTLTFFFMAFPFMRGRATRADDPAEGRTDDGVNDVEQPTAVGAADGDPSVRVVVVRPLDHDRVVQDGG